MSCRARDAARSKARPSIGKRATSSPRRPGSSPHTRTPAQRTRSSSRSATDRCSRRSASTASKLSNSVLSTDFQLWRGRLRLASALVMLAFVITHLSAHSTLLISLDFAQNALVTLMRPWRSAAGTSLLLLAFFVHYANALWSIYERRSLRLTRWQWAQLGFGLCIPLLLALHLSSTRLAEAFLGTDNYYVSVLTLHWVLAPRLAVIQAMALATVWIHASIGIHFWLRTKLWYPQGRPGFAAFALLLPTLALSRYLSAGNQVLREAAGDPAFGESTLGGSNTR